MKKILALLICLALFLPASVRAEPLSGEKILTKGEAVTLLSATGFMKKKIEQLFSWTVGYDPSKINRVRLTPMINYVAAIPSRVPPDGRTVLEIVASVDDPGGLANVSGVRADLSAIGRLPNTGLVDNGLFGDKKASDGLYTLQTSVPPQINLGPKEVPVTVSNKKGWLALAKTTLDISKNPVIIDASFTPGKILQGERQPVVTLMVSVDNPGRAEDIAAVIVDLTSLGYGRDVLLRNDGRGADLLAGDDIFTLQLPLTQPLKKGRYQAKVLTWNVLGGRAAATAALEIN